MFNFLFLALAFSNRFIWCVGVKDQDRFGSSVAIFDMTKTDIRKASEKFIPRLLLLNVLPGIHDTKMQLNEETNMKSGVRTGGVGVVTTVSPYPERWV